MYFHPKIHKNVLTQSSVNSLQTQADTESQFEVDFCLRSKCHTEFYILKNLHDENQIQCKLTRADDSAGVWTEIDRALCVVPGIFAEIFPEEQWTCLFKCI